MEQGYISIQDHTKIVREQRKDFLFTFGIAFCVITICWAATIMYAIGSYFGTYYDEGIATTTNTNTNTNTNNIGGTK